MRHQLWQGREPIRRVSAHAEANRKTTGEAAHIAYDIDDWTRRRGAAPCRQYVSIAHRKLCFHVFILGCLCGMV